MVYAVYRTHQALTDIVQKGELEMAYLITYTDYLKNLTVTAHGDKAQAQAAGDATGGATSAYVVQGEADLDGLTPKLMLDIFNRLGMPIERWRHGKPEATKRLFQRLVDIGKLMTQMQAIDDHVSSEASSKIPLTTSPEASTSSPETQQPAATNEQEDDMAKKAKSKSKSKAKAKTTRAKKNGAALVPGSKQEKLYNALCRDGGCTVAQLNTVTGWKESRATAKKVCIAMGRKLVKIEEEGKATRYAAQ